uniref:Uncharacterized protein n=1 Tax=Mus spicilegus TaxID=10103 RepID=A0A8C6IGZ8_MUSSI
IPGCPGTHSVNQAGLELRNPPASASQVLGLKAYTTIYFQITFCSLCVLVGHLWVFRVGNKIILMQKVIFVFFIFVNASDFFP